MDLNKYVEETSKDLFIIGREYRVVGYREDYETIKSNIIDMEVVRRLFPIGSIVIYEERLDNRGCTNCSFCKRHNNKWGVYKSKEYLELVSGVKDKVAISSCYVVLEGEV